MPKPGIPDSEQLELELIDAAVRYVVVADWFESRPSRSERDREHQAMEAFNRVEAELRAAGSHLLRCLGCRQLALEQALGELVGQ